MSAEAEAAFSRRSASASASESAPDARPSFDGHERAFIEELGFALFRSGCPTDIIEDRTWHGVQSHHTNSYRSK